MAAILHIPQAETLDPSILNLWNRLSNDSPPPLGDSAFKQRNWDLPVAETTFNRLLNQGDKARLLAVSADHSSDWLHAFPISSCGLRLEDEAIRVAVGLRLGCNLCLPHKCPCGTEVEDNGRHGLSCKKSGARTLRHNALNDVIHRALVKGGVPSTKEPTGLIRTDGKRPDGVTQVPWEAGKCLTWDVTVVDTLAPSYVALSSISAGKAAERAAELKTAKYISLTSTHSFIPVAFETVGPPSSSAVSFIKSIGKRLRAATSDDRETSFLFQRLSICIQRYNCLCIKDSFISVDVEDQQVKLINTVTVTVLLRYLHFN